MSNRYKKENPNLTIGRIAKDYGTTVEALQPHLDRLKILGLISHHGRSKETIRLTKNGKQFNSEL